MDVNLVAVDSPHPWTLEQEGMVEEDAARPSTSTGKGATEMAEKITVYVGYSDGKPIRDEYSPYGIKALAVFTSRRVAKKAFQDVRKATLVLGGEGDE